MNPGEPPRIVVLISGRGSNCQALHRASAEGWLGARIAAVISDRADAAGLSLAAEAGLDTVAIEPKSHPDRDAFEHALSVAIDGFEPRYVALAGFMRVLGPDFVNRYRGRLINIHPSLLPRHRGLATHRRVLEAGESEHGASVHFVTPDLDAGPVIARVRIEVDDNDTPDALADRLLPLEHRLYPATLALLLNHQVELRDDEIHIDNQALQDPLLLDRDLGRDGSLRDDFGTG